MQINLPDDSRCPHRLTGNERGANGVSAVTLIGSYAPCQCGLATFARDLRQALLASRPSLRVPVAAVSGESGGLHPQEVDYAVTGPERSGYGKLRDAMNGSGTDAVILQHDYSIFGGPDGAWILDALRGLRVPAVTICHTVPADPSARQRQVLGEIARLSAGMVVMTARGRDLLTTVYGVPAAKVTVIPHGIPDAARNAREAGRQMGWSQTGPRYLHLLDEVTARNRPQVLRRCVKNVPDHPPLDHLHHLTGSRGIYRLANLEEPDREHGYRTDDHASALITTQDLLLTGHPDLGLLSLRTRTLEFVRDAFDRGSGRFRNLRSSAGEWLGDPGGGDCHGRALWALGHTVRHASNTSIRNETVRLFYRALPAVYACASPRVWAFTLLGLAELRKSDATDEEAAAAQSDLAVKLMNQFRTADDGHWCWFEDALSYENARLPQALLAAAAQTGDENMRTVALRSLAWLMKWQQAKEGHFRPIGTEHAFRRGDPAPAPWDQQPLEATASLAACIAAYRLSRSPVWLARAERAFAWFTGANDAGLAVGCLRTGACCDALQADGLNQNCGAESTLAFLQACADMRPFQIARDSSRRWLPSARRNGPVPVAHHMA